MTDPTHGALFAGIGGFELGAESAGFRTIWNAEFDPTPSPSTGRHTPIHRQWPARVLKHHFPEVPNLGDVSAIRKPPAVDVVSFGSPCQDLSVAGRRAGLGGSRSHLFFEAARIINECRPAFAIWENVPGAFSSDAGRDLWTVLYTFRELGAYDVAWRVFDSQYAGVPQQRRRIYLVADFRGRRAGEVLFDPDGCSGHPSPFGETGQGVAASLTRGSSASGINPPGRRREDDSNLVISKPLGSNATGGFRFDLDHDTYVVERETRQVSPPVVSKWSKGSGGPAGDETQNMVVIQDARNLANKEQNGVGVRHSDTAYTLDGVSQQAVAYAIQERAVSDNLSNGPGGKGWREDNQAYTLEARHSQIVAHAFTSEGADASEAGTGRGTPLALHGTAIRRFTPTECERLQGFPDGWTCLCGSGGDMFTCRCPDGPRYRALGNACTVNITEWIFHRMRSFFD